MQSIRRMIIHWIMAAGVLIWLSAGCTWSPLEPVAAAVESSPTDARVDIVRAGERTVIEVHSPSGIGRSRIALSQALQPGPVEFRLHLAGLEHFELAYADRVVALAVPGAGAASQVSVRTAAQPEVEVTPGSPHWLEVDPPVAGVSDPVYHVVAPPDLIDQQPQVIEISWVDFYR